MKKIITKITLIALLVGAVAPAQAFTGKASEYAYRVFGNFTYPKLTAFLSAAALAAVVVWKKWLAPKSIEQLVSECQSCLAFPQQNEKYLKSCIRLLQQLAQKNQSDIWQFLNKTNNKAIMDQVFGWAEWQAACLDKREQANGTKAETIKTLQQLKETIFKSQNKLRS